MVVIEDGEINKSEYRKFKIKTVDGANDAAALREVLQRRFSHVEWATPDVIVVDGNEVQKKTAEEIVEGIAGVSVVAVVKNMTLFCTC